MLGGSSIADLLALIDWLRNSACVRSSFPVLAASALVIGFCVFRIRTWVYLRSALAQLIAGNPKGLRARLRFLARRVGAPASRWIRFYDAVGLFWEGRLERALAALDSLESDGFGPLLGAPFDAMRVVTLLLLDRGAEASARYESSRASIEASTRMPPGVPKPQTLQALLAFDRGDRDASRRLLESSDESEPVVRLVQFHLAAIAEGQPRLADARKPEPAVSGLRAWIRSLCAGLFIFFFMARKSRDVVADFGQMIGLMLTNVLWIGTIHTLMRGRHSDFFPREALLLIAPIPLVFVAAFFASAVVQRKEVALRIACSFYAALPWLLAARALAERTLPYFTAKIIDIGLGFWAFCIFLTLVLVIAQGASFLRVLATGPCLVLVWLLPMWETNFVHLWIWIPHDIERRDDATKRQTVSERFFEQAELLHMAEDNLAPNRRGVTDLYFVGFAAYGSQDVFYRDVRAARTLLDSKFDTAGRSLLFSNDESTRNNVAAASKENLRHALRYLGTKMSRTEDILFVYLTSHGSQAGLAIDSTDAPELFGDFELTPKELRAMLDQSGVISRVVVVAGCESGTFIDPLKNEDTLVATSAAVDRVSYGCAIGNEFTQFGRALFAEELMRQKSIVGALRNAIETIHAREVDAGLKESNPQLWVGSRIGPKLDALAEGVSR